MSNQIELIQRLSEMLSCMMDYAAEGGASSLIGFRESYKESADVLDEAHKEINGIQS